MKCLKPIDEAKTSYDILMDAQMNIREYFEKPIKSKYVLKEILGWYHITEEKLFLYRYNRIKRVYMFLLHEVSFLDYGEISKIVNLKRELEVIYGIEKIKADIRKDIDLSADIVAIVERLKSYSEVCPDILDSGK